MTCVNAVEVTSPDGDHQFVSLDPINVLDGRYPWRDGWTLRPITGRHTTHGFHVPPRQGAGR